jgi:hypothetical protein
MTTKADFNAEQWATVVEGPLDAALQVIVAEHGGTIRETLAVGRAYAEARKHHGDSPLLDEIVATPPSLDVNRLREAGGDVKGHTTQRLSEAVTAIESAATPDEAQTYKQFVLTVAEAAANANREGGFAGIGGKPVSASEQAALDELRTAMRIAD